MSNADAGAADVLQFLRTPATHGVAPGELSWSETHMSWLFFTPDEVLKLKKAVRTPYLDHTTLARRERDCREELRLNERLAPGVYLGLKALQRSSQGLALVFESALPAPGRTVDWLVRMRRLPESASLERRLTASPLDPAVLDAVAALLGRFYRAAARQWIPGELYLRRLLAEQGRNRDALLDPRWTLSGVRQALDGVDVMLARHAETLRARADGGHLVEGHGDLRPEHVFLLDPPVVIDALEFDPALRIVDPYDEIGFLGLECERLGAPWVGPRLRLLLARGLGGEPDPDLMRLYAGARALLRARLALGHLLDLHPRDPVKWLGRAQWYVQRALSLCGAGTVGAT